MSGAEGLMSFSELSLSPLLPPPRRKDGWSRTKRNIPPGCRPLQPKRTATRYYKCTSYCVQYIIANPSIARPLNQFGDYFCKRLSLLDRTTGELYVKPCFVSLSCPVMPNFMNSNCKSITKPPVRIQHRKPMNVKCNLNKKN